MEDGVAGRGAAGRRIGEEVRAVLGRAWDAGLDVTRRRVMDDELDIEVVDEPANARETVAIVAIGRNEGPYVREWVAYHKLIGADHILFYDHDSTDGTRRVLEPMVAAGLVEYQPWSPPPRSHAQRLAYADAIQCLVGQYDWVALIDLDEFLVLPRHSHIGDLLHEYRDRDAIAVNWKLFGTSGDRHYYPGLVIDRFRRCAVQEHSGNRTVKTIARPESFAAVNLHNHEFQPGVVYATVHDEVIAPGMGRSETVSHDIVRLNHYFTKSREEWEAKVARGRATKPEGHPDKFRTERHFSMHDRNEATDDGMDRWSYPVRQFLANF